MHTPGFIRRSSAAALLILGLAGAAALGGCGTIPGRQPSPNAPAPVTGAAATPTASSASAPSSAPTPSPSPAACPSGSYRITALKGQGSASQLGSGVGGDVTLAFADGTFTLHSDGRDPIKMKVGPANADLTIAGDITGRYSGDASALKLSVQDASGTAKIKGGFVNRQLTLRQLADQIVPLNSTGSATCDGDQATLTLPNVALTLARS